LTPIKAQGARGVRGVPAKVAPHGRMLDFFLMRVKGVEEPDPPEVNPRKGSENSSSRSTGSLGEKEGAYGFLPELEEVILLCEVCAILR
jgi:hypothetical protein